MHVIRLTKKDSSIVGKIIAQYIDASNKREDWPSPRHLNELLDDDRTYLLAAISGDAIAGYTLAYRFPSLYTSEYLAYLYDIEVAVAFRRQGIGRLLIKALLDYLKSDGVKEVWLGTAVDNTEGQGLFQATGAVKSGETFHDYTYYLS